MEDAKNPKEQLESLKELQNAAAGRVPALVSGLGDCICLAKVWLEFLQGKVCDEDYIIEEINLAKNGIHKSEMQLLLAKMELKRGETKKAEELLRKLAEYRPDLYSGREAAKILREIS